MTRITNIHHHIFFNKMQQTVQSIPLKSFFVWFATCDGEFPIAEWERLLKQAELNLDSLRTS